MSLGEFSNKIKEILGFKYSNIVFSEMISKIYFDNLYDKYTNIPKGWKKRNNIGKDKLFSNFKIVKNGEQYLGGFSINKFRDGYLIECLYSEIEGIGISKFIISELKKSNSNIYAFSKNDNFYGFNKLDEFSETGACLFVYQNKNGNLHKKI